MICLYVFKLLDARKRKTIEEGKLEAIAPKGMGIKSKGTTSSKEILATIPENYEIMLPIKFLEIDIAGKANAEMPSENSSKKRKRFSESI